MRDAHIVTEQSIKTDGGRGRAMIAIAKLYGEFQWF
jgi:hypothetical protein